VLIALASPRRFKVAHYGYAIFVCQEKSIARTRYLAEWYTSGMKVIDTTEAARRLNVTPSRVRAMIDSGRLKATKIGIVWMIDPKDLEAVKNRKTGRPRKSAQKLTKLPKKSARKVSI
jgi:excisionase family DNA binding protein